MYEEKSTVRPVTLHTHGQKHLHPKSNCYRDHDGEFLKNENCYTSLLPNTYDNKEDFVVPEKVAPVLGI